MHGQDELWQLLHAGDWACAHADDEALERVAGIVAAQLRGELARALRRVGILAARDMSAASLLWGQLAERLRAAPPPAFYA
jgi:hypothetical protein